jgi:hypothetical protein
VSRTLVTSLSAAVASLLLTLTAASAHANPVPVPAQRPAFVQELPEPPNTDASRSELDTLAAEQPHRWPATPATNSRIGWLSSAAATPRETVLRRDGHDVVTDSADDDHAKRFWKSAHQASQDPAPSVGTT